MKELLVDETLEDHDKNSNGAIEADEFNARGHSGLFDEVGISYSESAYEFTYKNRFGSLHLSILLVRFLSPYLFHIPW